MSYTSTWIEECTASSKFQVSLKGIVDSKSAYARSSEDKTSILPHTYSEYLFSQSGLNHKGCGLYPVKKAANLAESQNTIDVEQAFHDRNQYS